jgi:antitoxin (DNA-binding transcriptional repressor) of toxin-antitoxin stability system
MVLKIPISEARRRLPELVRKVRKDKGITVQITVHEEIVAELRGALPEPKPGAAARKLRDLMQVLPQHRGKKLDTSRHAKDYLYGGRRNR